jgi:hypothetical protein
MLSTKVKSVDSKKIDRNSELRNSVSLLGFKDLIGVNKVKLNKLITDFNNNIIINDNQVDFLSEKMNECYNKFADILSIENIISYAFSLNLSEFPKCKTILDAFSASGISDEHKQSIINLTMPSILTETDLLCLRYNKMATMMKDSDANCELKDGYISYLGHKYKILPSKLTEASMTKFTASLGSLKEDIKDLRIIVAEKYEIKREHKCFSDFYTQYGSFFEFEL